MLSTLDTVIAFAVIMTVLSLLITIIVQMVSAAFSLRGKNLANALSLTFQTIDPKIKEHAYSLSAQILRDPIFSDSVRQKKDRSPRPVNAATEAFANAERRVKDAQKKRDEAAEALAVENTPKNQAVFDAAVQEVAAAITALGPAAARAKDAQKKHDEAAQALAVENTRENQVAFDAAVQEVAAAKTELEAAGIHIPPVKPNRKKPWGFIALDSTKLGTAIRPGEIYRIIHEFAALSETEAAIRDIPKELVEKCTSLIAALTKSDQPAEESKQKLECIAGVANVFATDAQKKAVVDALANFGMTVERATTQAYDRFQRWFGSAQDRAEQWFQMHIRSVTVAAAIATAFVLQLDTTEMFRTLRDNPKLVDALVKSAPGVLQEGATVVDQGDTPAYHAYKLWLRKHPLFPITLPSPGDGPSYRKALAERVTKDPNKKYPVDQYNEAFAQARKSEDGQEKSEAVAAKAAYLSWLDSFPGYKLDLEPDEKTATKDKVVEAINARIEEDIKKPGTPDELVGDYDALQTPGAMAFEKARSATFGDLQQKLSKAGFDLAPIPFWDRWAKEARPDWATCWWTSWISLKFAHLFSHFLGIVITAGLLSLGAPFWFNLLKNMMSLRPAVANLMEKRPSSAPALPSTPDKPASSS